MYMSGTSAKIFGNDMAMDVKADFDALYGIGKSLDEIHEYIFSYQPDDDDEDACAYWSALALIEWEYGILEETIKNKAISIIKNHNNYYLYDNAKNQKARQEELAKLVTILSKSNESPRKPKKTYIYRCPYKVGDVLALPIKNKYVYLHISSITRKKKKIKELEGDDMCVKVFDKVSDSLLTIDEFKTNVLNRNQYMNLDKWKQCDMIPNGYGALVFVNKKLLKEN